MSDDPIKELQNWFATARLRECEFKCGLQIPLVVYAAYLTWHVKPEESNNKWLNVFLSNLNFLIVAVAHGDLRGFYHESRLPLDLAMKYQAKDVAIDIHTLIEIDDFCEWSEKSGLPLPSRIEIGEHIAEFLLVNSETLLTGFEFPEEAEDESAPSSLEGNSGRRNKQHTTILEVIAQLEFSALQIPDGGKSEIKKICCLTHRQFFTPEGFDHAWKAGVSAGLFKMANHEKFSSK